MLTQARLKEFLHYDPETGVFTWVKSKGPRKAGSEVSGKIGSGYVSLKIFGKSYLAHRLAWLYVHGEWPCGDIDHINRVRDDNRISNLRDVPRSENLRNTDSRKDNISGHIGVHWCKRRRAWTAQIQVNKNKRFLGYFANIEDAIAARKAAETPIKGYNQ